MQAFFSSSRATKRSLARRLGVVEDVAGAAARWPGRSRWAMSRIASRVRAVSTSGSTCRKRRPARLEGRMPSVVSSRHGGARVVVVDRQQLAERELGVARAGRRYWRRWRTREARRPATARHGLERVERSRPRRRRGRPRWRQRSCRADRRARRRRRRAAARRAPDAHRRVAGEVDEGVAEEPCDGAGAGRCRRAGPAERWRSRRCWRCRRWRRRSAVGVTSGRRRRRRRRRCRRRRGRRRRRRAPRRRRRPAGGGGVGPRARRAGGRSARGRATPRRGGRRHGRARRRGVVDAEASGVADQSPRRRSRPMPR